MKAKENYYYYWLKRLVVAFKISQSDFFTTSGTSQPQCKASYWCEWCL